MAAASCCQGLSPPRALSASVVNRDVLSFDYFWQPRACNLLVELQYVLGASGFPFSDSHHVRVLPDLALMGPRRGPITAEWWRKRSKQYICLQAERSWVGEPLSLQHEYQVTKQWHLHTPGSTPSKMSSFTTHTCIHTYMHMLTHKHKCIYIHTCAHVHRHAIVHTYAQTGFILGKESIFKGSFKPFKTYCEDVEGQKDKMQRSP